MSNVEETLKQRAGRYGDMVENARITQGLMDVVMQSPSWANWTPMHRECVHMIFHKIARMACGDCLYDDNIIDLIGYATRLKDFIIEQNKIKEQSMISGFGLKTHAEAITSFITNDDKGIYATDMPKKSYVYNVNYLNEKRSEDLTKTLPANTPFICLADIPEGLYILTGETKDV